MSIDKPILALRLQHKIIAALTENGYKTLRDLENSSAQDLSIELNTNLLQAEEILRQIQIQLVEQDDDDAERPPGSPTKTQTHSHSVSTLLSTPQERYSTQCPSIDHLLSSFSTLAHVDVDVGEDVNDRPDTTTLKKGYGSISPGMNVEISGPPGIGKTCICTGIALSAISSTASSLGEGDGGTEVLIVDTEGAITPERLATALEALHRTNPGVSLTNLLERIHLIRIFTQVQMIAFIHTLSDWIEEHPRVKLVIIDTLSFHFRQPSLDMNARRRFMELVKHQIGKLTLTHSCAVVVTSQLATKLLTNGGKAANFDTGDRAVLMPQLGDSWTTAKTVRIVLFRGGPGDEMRYAHASTLAGHKEIPWAAFDINNDGLPCDLPPEE